MEEFSINEVLDNLGEARDDKEEPVVYGVTDRSTQPFWVRFQDFFVDRQKIPLKEKSYFFHLLSVMLDAGIPMLSGLGILAEKSTHPHFKRILYTVAHYVKTGQPLSEAMAKFPNVFDETEIGVIRSGEAIGRLDEMLARLSAQVERMYEVHLKVRGALTYPVVVMVILLTAVFVVMGFVIPKLEDFFDQGGVKLPWLTNTLIIVSRFTMDHFLLLTLALFFAVMIAGVYANTGSGRLRVDYWKLKVPFMGDLIQKGYLSRFVRMLGVLASSGLPVHRALDILSDSMGNVLYRMKLKEVVADVERGSKISASLASTPFLFPETVTQMLSIGENSATLDQAAEKLADHYDQEIEHSVKNMTTLLEPLVIVFVGVAVGVLAFAILGPVFSLSELV